MYEQMERINCTTTRNFYITQHKHNFVYKSLMHTKYSITRRKVLLYAYSSRIDWQLSWCVEHFYRLWNGSLFQYKCISVQHFRLHKVWRVAKTLYGFINLLPYRVMQYSAYIFSTSIHQNLRRKKAFYWQKFNFLISFY